MKKLFLCARKLLRIFLPKSLVSVFTTGCEKFAAQTFLLGLLVLFLASCSSADNDDVSIIGAGGVMATDFGTVASAPASPDMDDFLEFDFEAVQEEFTPYLQMPILTPSATSRRLVYTVSLRLQTDDFMPGVRRVLNTVVSSSGYLTFADIQGRDMFGAITARNAQFTMRIPTENLADFILEMEEHYNVLRLHQTVTDETDNHRRFDNQIELHQADEEMLLEIMSTLDEDDSDLAEALQRELNHIRNAIREIELQQDAIDHDVIYSNIEIVLLEAIPPTPIPEPEEEVPLTFGERFNDTVATSIEGVISFLQSFVIIVIVILPALVLCGVIGLIIFFTVRKYKKHFGNKEK